MIEECGVDVFASVVQVKLPSDSRVTHDQLYKYRVYKEQIAEKSERQL